MKNIFFKTAWLLTICLLFTTACEDAIVEEVTSTMDEQEKVQEEGQVIPGKYIVVFKEDYLPSSRVGSPKFTNRDQKVAYTQRKGEETRAKVRQFLRSSGINDGKVKQYYTSALSGFAAELTDAEVDKLKADPNIASVEFDKWITLPDPIIIDPPIIINLQRQSCAVTNAGGFQDGSTKGTWIWIVDTGIDLDHADLNVQTSSVFAKSFADSSPDDAVGHGTHVAGIAGAKNNLYGVVGVSAGAKVVPVDVFGSGTSTATSIILAGINHVSSYDIAGDVMNLSLGGYFGSTCSTSSSYITAINNVANGGTRIAIAAGNDNSLASFYQPACINRTNVFTVASMDCDKSFSVPFCWGGGSNRGSYWSGGPIDYIATGNNVFSTYKGGGYATLCGTSMAAPVIAGILHAKNAAPAFGGWVPYSGDWYRIGKL